MVVTKPVVAVVVVGAEVVGAEAVGAELDEVLGVLAEGGAVVLGEPPPGPAPPGDPPAPLVVAAVLAGLVVGEEPAPGVEVPVGREPDGAPPGVELPGLLGTVPLGEVDSGRVVGEVVPGLTPAGEPVPVGDVVPWLVGMPVGELPPELPGTVPNDEVLPGLDGPFGELVLGPVPGEPPVPGELPPRPPGLVGDVPLGLVLGEPLPGLPGQVSRFPGSPRPARCHQGYPCCHCSALKSKETSRATSLLGSCSACCFPGSPRPARRSRDFLRPTSCFPGSRLPARCHQGYPCYHCSALKSKGTSRATSLLGSCSACCFPGSPRPARCHQGSLGCHCSASRSKETSLVMSRARHRSCLGRSWWLWSLVPSHPSLMPGHRLTRRPAEL